MGEKRERENQHTRVCTYLIKNLSSSSILHPLTSTPLRGRQIAPIDDERRAGYAGGIFAAQEQNRFGYILGCQGASERHSAQTGRQQVMLQRQQRCRNLRRARCGLETLRMHRRRSQPRLSASPQRA